MSLQASEVDRLIDFKNGQVSRDLFVNEDLGLVPLVIFNLCQGPFEIMPLIIITIK